MRVLKKAKKIMIKNGEIIKMMKKKNITKTERVIKRIVRIKKKKLSLLMTNRSNKSKHIVMKKKIKIIIKINKSRSLQKRIKRLNNKSIKSMVKLTKNMRTNNQSIIRLNNKMIIKLKKY